MLDRTNPYETPSSAIAEPDRDGRALFCVGGGKLALLSLATFGLYQGYWFYENWRRTRDHEGSTIAPLFRGIFAPMFAYPLFARRAEAAGVPAPWAPSTLALLYTATLPVPLSLAFLGAFLPLLRAQQTAAELNVEMGLPAHPWAQISPLHWIAIVAGLALQALIAALALGLLPA